MIKSEKMRRRWAAMLVTPLLALGLVVLTPSGAWAATCGGSLIAHNPIKNGSGTVLGYVDVYYSSASGGTNCVRTNSAGPTYGVAKFMLAKVYRCTGGAGSNCSDGSGGFDQRDEDKGTYSYYAGPVSVTGTANRCISYVGLITWGGRDYSAGSSPHATFCG